MHCPESRPCFSQNVLDISDLWITGRWVGLAALIGGVARKAVSEFRGKVRCHVAPAPCMFSQSSGPFPKNLSSRSAFSVFYWLLLFYNAQFGT